MSEITVLEVELGGVVGSLLTDSISYPRYEGCILCLAPFFPTRLRYHWPERPTHVLCGLAWSPRVSLTGLTLSSWGFSPTTWR